MNTPLRIAAALAMPLLSALCSVAAARQPEFLSAEKRREDFDAFCRFVAEDYAYFDIKATDWPRTCDHYAPKAQQAADKASYIGVLERALGQLYDSHAHLAVNTEHSPRLVPSQSDLMATWLDGKAVITDVRQGSAAERSGIQAGDEILAVNEVSAAAAASEFEPEFVLRADNAAHDWALQVALAGRHDRKLVHLELKSSAGLREITYAPSFPSPSPSASPLLTATVTAGIGDIRIHNSLGEQSLVYDFDSALDKMWDARALIIDLRDTPSGGNSNVARGILSRIVDEVLPYQRHELVGEYRSTGIRRIWMEYVAPRGPFFRAPIVVLVSRWTGSMGEGLAIGLNATRRSPVIGRPMGHLLGALGEFTLPNSKIVVRVPVEKLFHVDGRPRESFAPCPIKAQSRSSVGRDHELEAAYALANRLVRMKSNQAAQDVCGTSVSRQ